jgi:hypothetical protein
MLCTVLSQDFHRFAQETVFVREHLGRRLTKGIGMNKNTTKVAGRVTAAAAIGLGLAASAVSVAAASEHGSRLSHDHGFSSKAHWSNGAQGAVTAVSATSVTILGRDGTSSTFAINTMTTFAEGSTAVTATDLVVGSYVDIQTSSTDTTTAITIDIKAARAIRLGGVVTAVTPTSVTVTGHNGTSSTFTISTATTFSEGGATVTSADLVVGSHVDIQVSSTALTTATSISIKAPRPVRLGGVVTAVTPTSVAVTGRDGTSSTFVITTTTTFSEGSTTVTAADLVVGDNVGIEVTSTNPTTATSVSIALARVSGQVTAISGDTITITNRKGVAGTIVVSSTTTYSKDGTTGALSDVVVDSVVSAQGMVGATPTTLDATSVTIGNKCASWGLGHIATGHLHFSSRGGSGQSSQSQGSGSWGSHKHGDFRR